MIKFGKMMDRWVGDVNVFYFGIRFDELIGVLRFEFVGVLG